MPPAMRAVGRSEVAGAKGRGRYSVAGAEGRGRYSVAGAEDRGRCVVSAGAACPLCAGGISIMNSTSILRILVKAGCV